ncbi:MAG TPA: response regulator [Gemmataceae bacterium]|nr:response regulator [Gemmataceae bacterium]
MRRTRIPIALIDDDRLWAETLAEFLDEKGFAAHCAEGGVRGLALLEKTPFSVAVVDLHMPDMDGLELVRQVRRRRIPVEVILISNDDDPFLAQRLTQEEGLPFLSKSAVPRLLVQTVEQALKARERSAAEARARAPWNRLLTGPAG